MDISNRITIIGGGLAGLTAAIHLSKIGLKVILIEKN
jgi:menaquinone-9 beta-reductase